jgi:hypothetical protein
MRFCVSNSCLWNAWISSGVELDDQRHGALSLPEAGGNPSVNVMNL